jgi:hypothetical protein
MMMKETGQTQIWQKRRICICNVTSAAVCTSYYEKLDQKRCVQVNTTLHESDGRLVLCLCLPPPTSTFDGRRLALLLNYLLRFSNMIIWSYLAGQLKFVPAALQGTHSQGLPIRTCEAESVK